MPYQYDSKAAYLKLFLHFSKTCVQDEWIPIISAVAHTINSDVEQLAADQTFFLDWMKDLFGLIVNSNLSEADFNKAIDEKREQYCLRAGITLEKFESHMLSIQSLRYFFTGDESHIKHHLRSYSVELSDPNKTKMLQTLVHDMCEAHLIAVISDIELFQFSGTHLFSQHPLRKKRRVDDLSALKSTNSLMKYL